MPRTPEQSRGLAFEGIVAQALGLEQEPGSGCLWHRRGDASGRGLRVSAKANPTTKRSWAQTRRELVDAIDMAAGTGDVAALAVEDQDGEQFVVMRLADAGALVTTEAQITRVPRRAERQRSLASVPVLMRDDVA